MTRRAASEIEEAAVSALVDSLGRYDVRAIELTGGPDLVVDIGGQQFAIEVRSVVTETEAERLSQVWQEQDRPRMLIADRIATGGRALLGDAGINYLDRRGALRIIEPPLIIDVVDRTRLPLEGSRTHPLSSQVAKEAAITCLLSPDRAHGVREIAGYIDRAPSAVSKAMAELRAEGLLTSQGEPAVPELFHELAGLWRTKRVALAAAPRPGDARRTSSLRLGLDDVEDTPGWALTDTVAAGSWGMPVIATGDYPPDFYVPVSTDLHRAAALLGEAADWNSRGCTVAVAPVRLVCLRRADHSQTSGEEWPVANHIAVALDLAQDRARGVEILDQWHPEGIARAW